MAAITRRQMLLGGSAVGVAAAAGGFAAGSATDWNWFSGESATASGGGKAPRGVRVSEFVSRPDLRPPEVSVLSKAPGTDPGYLMMTPSPGVASASLPDGVQAGPLMIDNHGEPVWFQPVSTMHENDLTGLSANFQVQEYQGKQVITFWRGRIQAPPGFGRGEYVIMDNSYQELHTVKAAGDVASDLHEFLITDEDTALITVYRKVDTKRGPVWEGVIQELDIPTGSVLFEWHSIDHVSVEESMSPIPENPNAGYAYFHINSVQPDGDALLVSARNVSTIYRIDKSTGKVLWRLGGKRSDFTMRAGSTFQYQHDARRGEDGAITLFDNGTVPSQSRAITLALDEQAGVARLLRQHTRPKGAVSASQGNAQFRPSGQVTVGWGSEPYISEFSQAGNLMFDATFGGELDSYRCLRMPWSATPSEPPAVAARQGEDGSMAVYASWNGATEVAKWRVLTGSDSEKLATVTEVARSGFETKADVDKLDSYVAVAALDSKGKVLATSKPVQPGQG